MEVLFKAILSLLLITVSLASDLEPHLCEVDIPIIKTIAGFSKGSFEFEVHFALATENNNRKPVAIALNDWSAIDKKWFDPLKKTFIIIHGYQANGKEDWILELKDALLDLEPCNVIIVDWSLGTKLNYATTVKNTPGASDQVANFLHRLREKLHDKSSPSNIKWNQLHFIGHSLGSHVSGQTAHKISKALAPFEKFSSFFHVKRITGLDPARPCFKTSTLQDAYRLDKKDADFVDIIHTQAHPMNATSREKPIENGFSLGTEELIGHVDFFMNGGTMQPECITTFRSFFENIVETGLKCSHKSAYRYFIESVKAAKKGSKGNDACKFVGVPWDGSTQDAKAILNRALTDKSCRDCREMGMGASKAGKEGRYLVITGTKHPYCQYTKADEEKVLKCIELVERIDNPKNLSMNSYIYDDLNDFFTEI